jgi:hypothetical protein
MPVNTRGHGLHTPNFFRSDLYSYPLTRVKNGRAKTIGLKNKLNLAPPYLELVGPGVGQIVEKKHGDPGQFSSANPIQKRALSKPLSVILLNNLVNLH